MFCRLALSCLHRSLNPMLKQFDRFNAFSYVVSFSSRMKTSSLLAIYSKLCSSQTSASKVFQIFNIHIFGIYITEIIIPSNEMKIFDWLIRIQHLECYCQQIFQSTTSDFTTTNSNVKVQNGTMAKVRTISFERPVNYLCDAWHVFPPKYEAWTHFNRPLTEYQCQGVV